MIKRLLPLFMIIITASAVYGANEEPDYPGKKGKIIHAKFCNPHPPKIDGVLDDAIWQKIAPVTDFLQTEPLEGVKPTQSTELRIAYDKEALYVAVHAFDTDPSKIVSKLNRRDNLNNSDRIRFYIDSQHDHQTAFSFGTNPNGVQFDSFISNDGEGRHQRRGQGDITWDAVWQVETKVDDSGWTAEFRIPLAMLRFSQLDTQKWGFNFQRYIERNREEIWWVMKHRGDSGLVSRFGHVDQLKGLHSPRRLELLPFVTGRSAFEPDKNSAYSGDTGFDMKYGISSGITLDATFNPDFGQVEADPEVLNLSVFETFYPEKRPFFIEGAHLFSTPFKLFHSRRIGKRPGTYSLQSGDSFLEKPDFTTIYGAAKVTGKTSGGMSFSIINAVTSPEYAKVNATETDPINHIDQTVEKNRLIEPLTNYFVGRATQDLWAGNSRIGVLFTAMNRKAPEISTTQNGKPLNAYSGGIDWNLWTRGGVYNFSGQSAFSARYLPGNRDNGYAVQANFSKEAGRLMHGGFKFSAISPGFNINDLGFNRRSNIISYDANLSLFTVDYHWVTRRIFLNVSAGWNRNFDGLDLEKKLNLMNWFQFKNYWSFSISMSKNLDVYDDLVTRGGPPALSPGKLRYRLFIDTDRRKIMYARLGFSYMSHRFGSRWQSMNFDITVKPSSWLNISVEPRYSDNFYYAQWVTNLDEDGDGSKDHFVFGELQNNVLDITFRTNVSFSRYLSLQMYMQPFLTAGHYQNYKELARAYSYDFTPYPLNENHDFKIASLKSNVVLRWEYRPGSTFYFVWTRSYRDYASNSSFRPGNDMRELFTNTGTNIVMIKWNYWLNI